MTKRVVIAGSRNFCDYDFFCAKVNKCLSQLKNEYRLIILSGHCRGTDLMAEQYAAENDFDLEIFPAEWTRYGKSAGPKRNKAMIDAADYVIAFTNGSKGSASVITYAKQKGIPIKIYYI